MVGVGPGRVRFLLGCMMPVRALVVGCFFFLMTRRPPRSTRKESSAASDVYKRQILFSHRFSSNMNSLSL
ncbi:hypothetical protein CDFC105_43953 [Clostridioides difficile]|nr:hypothetical protein CDFC105_43953 [Clostridioides difficile]